MSSDIITAYRKKPRIRSTGTSVHALPPEALVHILSFLSLKQRMRNSALVCKAWAAAAALATLCIPHDESRLLNLSQQKVHALGAWLHKCGGSVVRVAVRSWGSLAKFQFPWSYSLPQLQALDLEKLYLQPSSSSHPSSSNASSTTMVNVPAALAAAPAPLAGLTALTKLNLNECICYPALGCGMSHLSALSNLQALDLGSCELQPAGTPEAAAQQHMAVLNSALLQLQQLTSLTLSRINVDKSVLSGLSSLQQLKLEGLHCAQARCRNCKAGPASLEVLPRHLTHLYVTGDWQLSSSMLPGPLEFTRMLELVVKGVKVFEPAVLGHMPQLRSLHLQSVEALSPAGVDGVRSLLAAMSKLQQLQDLNLRKLIVDDLPEAEAQQYTALVASSCLTRLVLEDCDLPDGALAHMLAGNMQLPVLQLLQLGPANASFLHPRHDAWFDYYFSPLAVRDLGRLALCCPALQQASVLLVATATEPEDMAVAAASNLQQLTALTGLIIGGAGVDDAFAAQVLAQLTQLRELGVVRAPKLTVGGLAHLTQLQQLEVIWLNMCDSVELARKIQEEEEDKNEMRAIACGISMLNEAAKGDPPDVWQQLVETCRHVLLPDSLPAALILLERMGSKLEQRDKELAAAQGEIAALKQQLEASRRSWR